MAGFNFFDTQGFFLIADMKSDSCAFTLNSYKIFLVFMMK